MENNYPKGNAHVGPEAQEKLLNGIRGAVRAVDFTLGAAGGNAILEDNLFPYHRVTNDGISILRALQFEDPIENIGLNLVKEVSGKSDKEGGDGTTTGAVLIGAIVNEGVKHLSELSPMELDRQLNACLPMIEESIDKQKRIISENEVKAVASISAESEEIGSLIQEIYQKIGKEGILFTDYSYTTETYYEESKGVKIRWAKLVSPLLADISTTGQWLSSASVKNAPILIIKQKITAGSDISEFLYKLYHRGENQGGPAKEIVIFCDDIEANAIGSFFKMKTREEKPMKVVVIKMPTIWKDLWYEDLSKLTGATMVDGIALTFKNLKFEHLGFCENISVNYGREEDEEVNNTWLYGTKDVEDYIKELQEKSDDESKARASRINKKSARLFIGGQSDTEVAYKAAKLLDARNAAFLAMKDGVVAGGGVALLNASYSLPSTVGGRILKIALQAPMRQIMANAGFSMEWKQGEQPFLGSDALIPESHKGFDAKSGKIGVDMFEAQIIDPASVTKSSIRNALSVASKVLTSPVIVTLPPPEPQPLQPQMPMMQ